MNSPGSRSDNMKQYEKYSFHSVKSFRTQSTQVPIGSHTNGCFRLHKTGLKIHRQKKNLRLGL